MKDLKIEIKAIDAGNFLADGGAMFGVVPKAMWNKLYPCDNLNRCKVALRSLLIDAGQRVYLIDNGCGKKFNEKFYTNNHIDIKVDLCENLKNTGYSPQQITDVILTHLHFDHCGGSTYKDENDELQLTFPNATYYTTQKQWENMLNPNIREGSAIFKDDVLPLMAAGKLQLLEENGQWDDFIGYKTYHGHTPGQIIPWVIFKGRKIHYTGDLIPLAANIPTAWVSAYDSFPVTSMHEKLQFLTEVHKNNDLLFFEHDTFTECAELIKTHKGFKAGKVGFLSDFF